MLGWVGWLLGVFGFVCFGYVCTWLTSYRKLLGECVLVWVGGWLICWLVCLVGWLVGWLCAGAMLLFYVVLSIEEFVWGAVCAVRVNALYIRMFWSFGEKFLMETTLPDSATPRKKLEFAAFSAGAWRSCGGVRVVGM